MPMPALTRLAVFSLVVLLGLPPAAWSLQAEHEADRLLLATEEALADNNYSQAEEHLNAIRQLGITPPPEYEFFYGKLLHHRNNGTRARSHLENYVNRTGRDGEYYRDALNLITEIERERSGQSTADNTASSGTSEIGWSRSSQEYIDRIKELYETDDAIQALSLHVNNLLKFYAYGREEVVAGSRRLSQPTRHKIQVGENGKLISFNRAGATEEAPVREESFSVYGVDPYIAYQCNARASNCWLMHPVSNDRWLQVLDNREAAGEIAKALSELIKQMQKTS